MDFPSICGIFLLMISPFHHQRVTVTADQSLLFPFGVSEGDQLSTVTLDGSTSELLISTVFPFFDHDHNSLFVNNNGLISFLAPVSQFTPVPFPLGDGRRLIAPFWSDVDTRNSGNVFYREVLRFTSDDEIFLLADQIIQDNFIEMMRFQSSWMFVATWDSVPFYGTTNSYITNSFQAVLVTDGRYSFVIFNYGDINWTTGTDNRGDSSTGLGGFPAQVGFNAGDGVTYFSVPGSQTAAVVDIDETTNIGEPGRWVFRTDKTDIQGLQCTSTGDLSLFPLVGTMLGGTQVFISGPCFNDTSFLVCDFDGEFVSGELQSDTSALCVTPKFYKVGRVSLRVSIDGGETFAFQGVFTILNVEEVPVRVTSPATASNQRITELEVTWDKEALDFVDVVDIVVHGYRETESQVEFIGPMLYLATEIDYHLGFYRVVAIPGSFTELTEVGVIAVVESNTSLEGAAKATLWSEVHVLQWLWGYDTLEWCDVWISEESRADSSFLEFTPKCPCTFAQAQLDIGRFTAHPQCDADATSPNNCLHKPGAIHCVRANTPSTLGGGQECCYDSDGFIINVLLSPGGGIAHRYHHSGVAPYGEPTKVPYMSHFLADILPWTYCCRYRLVDNELDEFCHLFSSERPSQLCDGYVPPQPALGTGDPHIATLDSTMYTFNGYGEFTLLNTLDGNFTLQARTAPFPGSNATVFVAIAASFGDSDIIHVQISERRVIEAYMRLRGEAEFSRLDFDQAAKWSFSGLSVTGRNISGNGLLVAFEIGVGLQLKAAEGALSILLTAPEFFRGQTQGLMGTWNGNASDDFLTPQGVTLSPNMMTEELHYNFGLQWEIQAQNSLFFYEIETDHDTNMDWSYTPIFEPVQNPTLDQAVVLEVCGTNLFCVFDFQTTGSQRFAQASMESFKQYKIALLNTEIVTCPPPSNGSVVVSRYSVGGVANITYNEGTDLSYKSTLICQSDGKWWCDVEISDCSPTSATSELALPIYLICLISIWGIAAAIVG